MVTEHIDSSSESKRLGSETITERFDNLKTGDRFSINNRPVTYEVVDTYAVVAEGPNENRITVSQNLQSGGWALSEDILHVETE